LGRIRPPRTSEDKSVALVCRLIVFVPELTEQYVVSGKDFTMTFLLLAIQSGVCVLAVWSVKKLGIITCEWNAELPCPFSVAD
jgi:GDP-mannose transporter